MGLLSLNRVSLRYGDRVLLDAADLNVEAGDRMSLIGPQRVRENDAA